MELIGRSFIGNARGQEGGPLLHAINPLTGEPLSPAYAAATAAETAHAVELAAAAAPQLAQTNGKQRAHFLRHVADGLQEAMPELVARAQLETALPVARLQGETARTCGQLRLFASLIEEGSWVDARIDPALPDRHPLPRPDLRSMMRPLGPVAVFGASNFPLAFSAAGGDTASALAAGCPVVVKAHSAHPGTSEIVARVLAHSIAACNMPEGTYSLLYGAGAQVGTALVRHPKIQAVAFTGSLHGGRALMDAAAARPQPIPCFTEMSGVNPVFLLPGIFEHDPVQLAEGIYNSFTLGSGQFCTKPGLIFFTPGAGCERFLARLRELVSSSQPWPLLTPAIAGAYQSCSQLRATQAERSAQAEARDDAPACSARAQLFHVGVKQYLAEPQLAEEIFGPTTLLVECPNDASMIEAATALHGQLTATILGPAQELAAHQQLIALLEAKAGRILFNGFPTGVEVCHAMVHGGPYPSTSDARFTSVGTRAIYRFVRPVCFQGFPDEQLPEELRNGNPCGILRLVDGVSTREAILPKTVR